MKVIEKQMKLGLAAGNRIGRIKTKNAKSIRFSPFGIGLEKADGGFYDPSIAYPYISEIGVKWVRIQSGWARCEKTCGVYDFAWLDDMVENILQQGAEPWICLCYGNPIYDVRAPKDSRACGYAPIVSAELKNAWKKYVEKTVERYRGKVRHYEIWNEPDGTHCWKSGVNGKEYGKFVLETAAVIKKIDQDCKIIAGSMCNIIRLTPFCTDIGIRFDDDIAVKNFFEDWLSTGAADVVDYVSVHLYRGDPEGKSDALFKYLRKRIGAFNKKAKIIQGETGTHACFSRAGALNSFEWTERKQAKYLLRRMYTDFIQKVFITSYFSCLDMYENLNNEKVLLTKENFGFYGVLGAEFDENGYFSGKYRKRISFCALQNLCTSFSDGVREIKRAFEFVSLRNSYWGGSDITENDPLIKLLTGHSFESASGEKFEAFYVASSVLNIEYSGTVSITVNRTIEEPAFVDLLSGEVFAVKEENISRADDMTTLLRLPLKDYPCLLIDLKNTHFALM